MASSGPAMSMLSRNVKPADACCQPGAHELEVQPGRLFLVDDLDTAWHFWAVCLLRVVCKGTRVVGFICVSDSSSARSRSSLSYDCTIHHRFHSVEPAECRCPS